MKMSKIKMNTKESGSCHCHSSKADGNILCYKSIQTNCTDEDPVMEQQSSEMGIKLVSDDEQMKKWLIINGYQVPLIYCHCRKIYFGQCDPICLQDITGSDFPEGVHLFVKGGHSQANPLWDRLVLQKVVSRKVQKMRLEYTFVNDDCCSDPKEDNRHTFARILKNPHLLDRLKKSWSVSGDARVLEFAKLVPLSFVLYQAMLANAKYLQDLYFQC